MKQSGSQISRFGLNGQGLGEVGVAHWNYGAAALYEQAIRSGEGVLAAEGPLAVVTGVHTGRAVKDKFFVRETGSERNICWGPVNQPITDRQYADLKARVQGHLRGKHVYVQDLWAGADPNYRLPVRIVTEFAWHSLFVRNMFRRPTPEELLNLEPQFTIICTPTLEAEPARDGTKSGTFILVNLAERMVLIGGTSYAGEMKKSVFTILNYLLPERNVLPMHCSVNVGAAGDSAIFFGLSGTGKTTLSADPRRTLIGDDEHGWSPSGLFNFEGGCYAKVIKLSAEAEPEIYATTRRFGTVLENVVVDPVTRRLDLDDGSLTENTRASYPIDFIPNANSTGVADHPTSVIFLTADAFGVLPPIAKLSPEQAMYHFLSGYTARLAGTEKGLGREPQATFSTCFGAPFMPRHPVVYGRMLSEKVAANNVSCWLVNTGWTGGAYGTGHRMPIAHTRALVNAAIEGKLGNVPMVEDRNFAFAIPTACPGVPSQLLDPRGTWSDGTAYDAKARELAARFNENFVQFADHVDEEVRAAAPRRAA